jgi:RNA polymerase sigma-70 factor (ECF subfamily)
MMDGLTTALAADLDKSFPDLVDQAGPRLYWGLRGICGDAHEAEDLTQETLIRAYRALSGYPPERISALALSAWLWTIALNIGRNHLRDRARRPTYAAEEEHPVDDLEPPDTVAWERRLSALTGPQRRAVVLRHVVGMGIAEISEVTGRPEGTVKADIHRGLEKLRTRMEDET